MSITFSSHTIRTEPDPDVEPGHQLIYIGPADVEARSMLYTLTGILPINQANVTGLDGQTWVVAPHTQKTDDRLTQIVDLCADLRFSAQEMLQLRLELHESTDIA